MLSDITIRGVDVCMPLTFVLPAGGISHVLFRVRLGKQLEQLDCVPWILLKVVCP